MLRWLALSARFPYFERSGDLDVRSRDVDRGCPARPRPSRVWLLSLDTMLFSLTCERCTVPEYSLGAAVGFERSQSCSTDLCRTVQPKSASLCRAANKPDLLASVHACLEEQSNITLMRCERPSR